MKKIIFVLSLVALLSSSLTSCSADDSAMQETSATGFGNIPDNGDKDLPKPPRP